MVEDSCGQHLSCVLKNPPGQGRIALLWNQLGRVIRGKFFHKEKIGRCDCIVQQLDTFADERSDGEQFFRRGIEAGLLQERLDAGAKLLDGQRADMLGVEPDGLRIKRVFVTKVNNSVGAVDALECKRRGKLFECEELAVVFGRPAEQAEEVDESLGEESGIAIGGDADYGAMFPFTQLGAVGGDEQREMGEVGRRDAQALEDQQVLEGIGQVILAANDVADALIGVIHA